MPVETKLDRPFIEGGLEPWESPRVLVATIKTGTKAKIPSSTEFKLTTTPSVHS